MSLKLFSTAIAILFCTTLATAQSPQEKEAARVATREQLRQLLTASGPKRGIEIPFRQSEKRPFNFVGVKRGGLTNAEGFEIVVGVSNDNTIGFRIYPYYKGGYININKAKDGTGLARKLLNLNLKVSSSARH